MKLKIIKILIPVAAIAAIFVTLQSSNNVVTLENGASLKWVKCWFKAPAIRKVRCGWYSPKQTNSIKIRIPVVYVHYTHKTQKDPVLHINGGPGFSTGLDKKGIQRWLGWVDQTGWKRDVVFWDHRGTGLATPLPECVGLQGAALFSLSRNETAEQENRSWFEFMKKCQQVVGATKIPFDSFSTDHSVEDSLNIMKLIGAKHWKIYSASYGTRVALQLMRRYSTMTNPIVIDSIVLDSVYPSRVHDLRSMPYFLNRAFDNLFKACDLHYFCFKQFPSLKKSLLKITKHLNQNPITLHIRTPSTPQAVKVVLNGNRFIWAIHGAMYDWSSIEKIPAYVLHAQKKQWSKVRPLIRDYVTRILDPSFSPVVYYSTECRDRDHRLSEQEYNRELKKYPFVKPNVGVMWKYDICKFWTSGRAHKSFFMPTKSNIPTLIMNGKLDPATPWQWAKEVHESLAKSYFFAIPGVGHGAVDGDQCSANLAKEFYNNPDKKPSLACQKHWRRPYFKMPESKSRVKTPIDPGS